MARSVYVTAMEPGSGKSAVVLGLTEVLSRQRRAAGVLPAVRRVRRRPRSGHRADPAPLPAARPARVTYALTADDLHNLDGRGDYDALLKRILDGYAALAATPTSWSSRAATSPRPRWPSSWISTSTRPATSAARCCWWSAAGGAPPEQVLDAVHQGLGTLTERGCVLLGVICNRVAPELVDPIRAGRRRGGGRAAGGGDARGRAARRAHHGRGGHPAGRRAPGPPGRASARPLRARSPGWSSARWGCRCSWSGSREGDLVITPGDRADIVAGTLAAHLSGTYPAVAGLVLTGGIVDDVGAPAGRRPRRRRGAGASRWAPTPTRRCPRSAPCAARSGRPASARSPPRSGSSRTTSTTSCCASGWRSPGRPGSRR